MEQGLQRVTANNGTTEVNKTGTGRAVTSLRYPKDFDPKKDQLYWQHEEYVRFVACGGVITEGGDIRFMSAQEFADYVGVARETLYKNWRHSIPDFWDRVNKLRREMSKQSRLQKVWAGVYLSAAAGNNANAKLYLHNFDDEFKLPLLDKEDDKGVNTLLELMQKARARQTEQEARASQQPAETEQRPNIIEGEVIGNPSGTPNTTNA